jgi:MFS family permease
MGVSFFFNSFQAFMLGVSNESAQPLSRTVSLYTFAWSLGFGVGPFIAGIAVGYLSWADNYYLAAAFSALIALIILGFRASRHRAQKSLASPSPERQKSPALYVPGWMGVVIGLIGWLTIATYWPVIAAQQGISPAMRGLVEFAFAMTQGIGALALILFGNWQRRIQVIPLFGVFGISALLVFGAAGSLPFYILGASLMGLFTAGTFLFSVYHCMVDSKMASKRVAVNEMMVGLGFLIGPGLAALLHQNGKPFSTAFLSAAFLVAGLVSLETWVAARISRKFKEMNDHTY